MLAALSEAIEARDPFMLGHSSRVAELAVALAERLGWSRARIAKLHLGGLLHDVGKLAVPQHVLRKPGALEPAEVQAIRLHPLAGAQLLEPFRPARTALACVLLHHERWDGSGYPTRCDGREIPIEARILAIADAFDAMTTARPYRAALRVSDALNEIVRCAGTQFDPELALQFVAMWDDAAAAAAS